MMQRRVQLLVTVRHRHGGPRDHGRRQPALAYQRHQLAQQLHALQQSLVIDRRAKAGLRLRRLCRLTCATASACFSAASALRMAASASSSSVARRDSCAPPPEPSEHASSSSASDGFRSSSEWLPRRAPPPPPTPPEPETVTDGFLNSQTLDDNDSVSFIIFIFLRTTQGHIIVIKMPIHLEKTNEYYCKWDNMGKLETIVDTRKLS